MAICLERGADCLHIVQLMPLHSKPLALMFHKVVRQRMQGLVGLLITTLLQIYQEILQWKIFVNRRTALNWAAVRELELWTHAFQRNWSQQTNWTKPNWPAPSWPSYTTRYLPPYSFVSGLKPPFSASPSHRSLFFFSTDSTDSPDCLPILLSISVFYFLVFVFSTFLVAGSVR